MKKGITVMSLGGSLIIPKEIDQEFLHGFKHVLKRNSKTQKHIIVCGGGKIARQYMTALKRQGKSQKEQCLAGIRATRMNARFLMQLFGRKEANDTLPTTMKAVENNLRKNNIVICGALRYHENETSDSTAAKLAHYFNTELINMTNVKGLFTHNPKTQRNARFISQISWEEFEKIAHKKKYKPGQHFILDQTAATIIKKHKITTYIIGKSLKNLSHFLNEKPFLGTTITHSERVRQH